jgi:hypothetical protein
MNLPTMEEQRNLVKQWETTGPLLEQIRNDALRGKPASVDDIDTALSMGDHYKGPQRFAEGMVEMQRQFMAIARKQGVIPPGHPAAKAPEDA